MCSRARAHLHLHLQPSPTTHMFTRYSCSSSLQPRWTRPRAFYFLFFFTNSIQLNYVCLLSSRLSISLLFLTQFQYKVRADKRRCCILLFGLQFFDSVSCMHLMSFFAFFFLYSSRSIVSLFSKSALFLSTARSHTYTDIRINFHFQHRHTHTHNFVLILHRTISHTKEAEKRIKRDEMDLINVLEKTAYGSKQKQLTQIVINLDVLFCTLN